MIWNSNYFACSDWQYLPLLTLLLIVSVHGATGSKGSFSFCVLTIPTFLSSHCPSQFVATALVQSLQSEFAPYSFAKQLKIGFPSVFDDPEMKLLSLQHRSVVKNCRPWNLWSRYRFLIPRRQSSTSRSCVAFANQQPRIFPKSFIAV